MKAQIILLLLGIANADWMVADPGVNCNTRCASSGGCEIEGPLQITNTQFIDYIANLVGNYTCDSYTTGGPPAFNEPTLNNCVTNPSGGPSCTTVTTVGDLLCCCGTYESCPIEAATEMPSTSPSSSPSSQPSKTPSVAPTQSPTLFVTSSAMRNTAVKIILLNLSIALFLVL